METSTKRAIIYCRVSTDEQRGNYSIPTQLEECMTYARDKGYSIVGDQFVDPVTGRDCPPGGDAVRAYVDDYSSLERGRPSLDAAFDYLETVGFDVVVVYNIDRLDRDPFLLFAHEKQFAVHNATVEFVRFEYEDSPQGEFLKLVVSGAGKLENAWRTERFLRGKRGKAKRGLFVGGRTPFGYLIDKTAPGGLTIVEKNAEIVKQIFHWYTREELSINDIAVRLDSQEIKPTRQGTWAKTTIRKILSNPTYIGINYYNKNKRKDKKSMVLRDYSDWIEIKVPAIIDQRTFEQAKERFEFNRKFIREHPKTTYLLGSMVFCDECRRPYVCQTERGGTSKYPRNLQIYRHRTKQGHCSNRRVNGPKLEDEVWQKIKMLILDPEKLQIGYQEALEKERSSYKHQYALKEKIEKSLVKYEEQMKRLNDVYMDTEIGMTKKEYLEQKTRINTETSDLQLQLTNLEEQLKNAPEPEEFKDLERFTSTIRDIIDNDQEITPEEKRDILKSLGVKIFINAKGEIRLTGWLGTTYSYYAQSTLNGYFSISTRLQ